MRSFFLNFVLLLSSGLSVAARTPFSRGLTTPSLFGIRGGGLFGGKDDKK